MPNETERTVAAVYADRLKHGGVSAAEEAAQGEALCRDTQTLDGLVAALAAQGYGQVEEWRRSMEEGCFLNLLAEVLHIRHRAPPLLPSGVHLVLDYLVRVELSGPGIATPAEAYACSFTSLAPLRALVREKLLFVLKGLAPGASRRAAADPYDRLEELLNRLAPICFPDEAQPFEEFSGVRSKGPGSNQSVDDWLTEGARHAAEQDGIRRR